MYFIACSFVEPVNSEIIILYFPDKLFMLFDNMNSLLSRELTMYINLSWKFSLPKLCQTKFPIGNDVDANFLITSLVFFIISSVEDLLFESGSLFSQQEIIFILMLV